MVVFDVHRDVLNTHTVVSDVRHDVSDIRDDVANTQTIVSEIHRTVVRGQEVTGGENPFVSVTCILSNTEPTLTVA